MLPTALLFGAVFVQIALAGNKNVDLLDARTLTLRMKDPEVDMNIRELITSKGYQYEEHEVTTKDGYILTLHRIPGKMGQQLAVNRPPVLLQHCFLCDSTLWLLNLPHQNLPFLLADKGADVWLGNNRGNRFSRKHRTLSPNKDEFWNFSMDEMAKYDLPAMLGHIRNVTNNASPISYVGHSQGTMIAFAGFPQLSADLLSSVRRFYALAPVTTVGHAEGPARLLATSPRLLYTLLGKKDFLSDSYGLIKFLGSTVCKFSLTSPICKNALFLICGFSQDNVNASRIPVWVAHTPSGASVKNVVHFAQMIASGRFEAYDYGSPAANKAHYNQTTPLTYKITPGYYSAPPVVAFAGSADKLATPTDTMALVSQLMERDPVKRPEPVLLDLVTIKEFNHLDFVWGTNANRLVFDYIVKDIFSGN